MSNTATEQLGPAAGLASGPADARVLVFAPLANDARLTLEFLTAAGLSAFRCADAECFSEEARIGAGVWLLAEEALDPEAAAGLGAILASQPSWSDVPIIVITSGGGEASTQRRQRLAAFGPGGNVSVLERPFRPGTMVSAVKTALRARRRQYQVRDLLARVRADAEELHDAHALLAGITEGTEELIAAVDLHCCLTAANRAYRHFFREAFGTEVSPGVSLPEALAHRPEERAHTLALWGRALQGENVSTTGGAGDHGATLRVFDRRFYPLRDPDGTIVGAAEIATDVTERVRMARQLEEQAAALQESRHFLRSTIDALSSHIAVLDADGSILEVNAAWKRFADDNGYLGSNHGVGTNYLTVLDAQESGECEELDAARGIRAVIHGELPRFQIEYPCHSPTEQRWYLMTVTRFPGPGAVRVVVAHENVTQRVLANVALREADRRKDEFLAMLAHELRNPLASVTNAATLLREGVGAEDHEWAAKVIDRQSSQLARLVNDLLNVSRITRGKIELRCVRLDAATALESACESVAPQIAVRSHTLLADFRPGELWLDADPTRLEQIAVNLLANAAKYTEPQGRIWLTARREGSDIVIIVRDTGIGIEPQKIPEMFELFTQGERSAARIEGGLGIGLTVVRRLCELHGGSISAHSAGPGQGSTFTVRLPAATPPAQVVAPATNGHTPAATVKPGGRILIVDDIADTANGLARLLTRRGYSTELAHDGPAALAKARTFSPAAVLLDIGLPGMDGFEVARRLRAAPEGTDVLIVALSGYGQEEDRVRSREAGFDHHLVKPVDFEELRALLASRLTAG